MDSIHGEQNAASGPDPEPGAVVGFRITDTGESFRVEAGRGISRVTPLDAGPFAAEAWVSLPEHLWLGLLFGTTTLAEALLSEEVAAQGDLATFVRFHRRFSLAAETPIPMETPRCAW